VPAAVGDEVVRSTESQLGPGEFVSLRVEFKPDERVMIDGGALENLAGIFLKEVNEGRRAAIIPDAVSYQLSPRHRGRIRSAVISAVRLRAENQSLRLKTFCYHSRTIWSPERKRPLGFPP
jgi:hypothetical protein